MKRFEICAVALTTGMPLAHNAVDSAAEALAIARKMREQQLRGVQIRDAVTEKFYTLEAFATEHRL